MADGHVEAPGNSPRRPPLWTNIFRCFPVALDPNKLAAAAAGILVMSLGWWLLSVIFDPGMAPNLKAAQYEGDGGAVRYAQDYEQWRVRADLAGEGGKLRAMPWAEDRGENPYLFTSKIAGSTPSTWVAQIGEYFQNQAPVLAEPLFKLLLPVIKLIDPNATPLTRFYLLLVILWGVATWAFFGGVITRIAAVQLSGKDRTTLVQAVRFVSARYWSYLLSPLVPLGAIAVIAIGLMVFALVALIPGLGDLMYGLLLPLVFLGGLIMAVLLIGLIGYPLMFTTLSVEGSDTFDALSRAYNYVFQAPWQYLWNGIIAAVYGVAITFFVVFLGSMTVYLGKWAICHTPILMESTNQKPDYLFVYAPETYGWKQLLLKGTDLEVMKVDERTDGRSVTKYPYTDPGRANKYKESYWYVNYLGAGLTTFWLVVVLLLMLGFGYSYFWSAATMIYLNMRNVVDETDLDEVYLEEELEAPAVPPPTPIAPPPSPAGAATSLPLIPPAPPSA